MLTLPGLFGGQKAFLVPYQMGQSAAGVHPARFEQGLGLNLCCEHVCAPIPTAVAERGGCAVCLRALDAVYV